MSSTTLISVQEYFATSYRPDCDLIDGELRERNLGELEHALLQSAIVAWFWTRRKEWNILPLVEQRVQVSATRFRIPDVSVLRADQPREPIITIPPLIPIEVLSKDDSLRNMRERVDDYLTFGVQNIWILDPASRRAYICSRTGFQERRPEHSRHAYPSGAERTLQPNPAGFVSQPHKAS
jgi:Uma2 family endonuclease